MIKYCSSCAWARTALEDSRKSTGAPPGVAVPAREFAARKRTHCASETTPVANGECIRDHPGYIVGALKMSEEGGEEKVLGGTPTAFISYASQDAAIANSLVEALEQQGAPMPDCPAGRDPRISLRRRHRAERSMAQVYSSSISSAHAVASATRERRKMDAGLVHASADRRDSHRFRTIGALPSSTS